MLVNQFSNHCSVCGIKLEAGIGFAFRDPNSGKYTPVCSGRICIEKGCPSSEIRSYERHMETAKIRLLKSDGTIEMPYELASLPLVRAMPGAKFDGKYWKISTELKDRRRVLELAKKINLKVDPSLETVEVSDRVKKLQESMKDSGLFPYQQEGVIWIAEQESCLLADDQGLGKTAQFLFSIDETYGYFIVCPTEVVYNWLTEGLEWRSDLSFSIVKRKKDFRIPKPGEVVILSYGMLPEWIAPEKGKRKNTTITKQQIEELSKCVVGYDEIHHLCNPQAKRSKLCKYLSRHCHHAIGLTGTPVRNRELELWYMFQILGLAETVFDNFPSFIKMMDGRKGIFGYKFGGNIRSDVPERLRRVMLRRLKSEVLKDLPPKVFEPIYIEAEKNLKIELDSAWDLYRRSSQFKSGELPEFKEMASAKKNIAISHIPVMMEQVESYEASQIPLIVVSCHVDPILTLKDREGWDIIIGGMTQEEKRKVVEKWQAGHLKGVAISLKAATTGITLTYGSHILRVDLDWVHSNNEQFSDRIHRIGQTEVCVYKDIISDHPLLRHIYKLNHEKIKLMDKTVEKLVNINPEINLSSINESQKDFDDRIDKVEKEENDRKRQAILRHISTWNSRIKVDQTRNISQKRAEVIKSITTSFLFNSSKPAVRKSGKFINSSPFSTSDAQILSLLNVAGFESQQELRLAEAILLQYYEVLHESHRNFFEEM